jgi:hypothetical protein
MNGSDQTPSVGKNLTRNTIVQFSSLSPGARRVRGGVNRRNRPTVSTEIGAPLVSSDHTRHK